MDHADMQCPVCGREVTEEGEPQLRNMLEEALTAAVEFVLDEEQIGVRATGGEAGWRWC